jgi:hypothetical protein
MTQILTHRAPFAALEAGSLVICWITFVEAKEVRMIRE